MIDNRTASAIDLALQKYDTPVGPLFVSVRHGRLKNASAGIQQSVTWRFL